MSANVLKIIALITMTIDHMGFILFPDFVWMRIVGRISFPIFAFLIAEGCRYTHSRLRYLLQISLMGISMQLVLFIVTGSLYQSVFISFTLAIMLIIQWFCLLSIPLIGLYNYKRGKYKLKKYFIFIILYTFVCYMQLK